MDEVAVIRIIGGAGSEGIDGSGGVNAGARGARGPKAPAGGMGAIMSGALKAVGVGSLVGLVAGLVSANKALLSVVGGVVRMLGYLLKPITDVVTALLMPVLFALKPIVMIVNRVMQPFIRLAMESFKTAAEKRKEGDFAGAAAAEAIGLAAGLAGVSSAMMAFLAESIKQTISSMTVMLGALLQPIFSFFGITEDQVLNEVNRIISGVSAGIDAITVTMIGTNANMLAKLADSAGVETEGFRTDVSKMISDVFNAPEGLTARVKAMLSTGDPEGFGYIVGDEIHKAIGGTEGITSVFVTEFESFKEKGVEKVEGAVKAMNDAWDDLKEMELNIRNNRRGLFDVIVDGIDSIFWS
jgi:hypothetical protein